MSQVCFLRRPCGTSVISILEIVLAQPLQLLAPEQEEDEEEEEDEELATQTLRGLEA